MGIAPNSQWEKGVARYRSPVASLLRKPARALGHHAAQTETDWLQVQGIDWDRPTDNCKQRSISNESRTIGSLN